MYLKITTEEFAHCVETTARFAGKGSASLPVLSCVLIVAGDDGVKFRATNLEIGIDKGAVADVKSTGIAAVPALVLKDLASSLPRLGTLELEKSGDTLTIRFPGGKTIIKTLSHDDFPTLPYPDESTGIKTTLSGTVLKSLISSVISCASVSTVRPELASVFLKAAGGALTSVATDSFRLSEKRAGITGLSKQFSILIPARNTHDFLSALTDEEVTLVVSEHQCAAFQGKTAVTTRLTSGTYPDYTQIIPKTFSTEATVLRKDFEQALRRGVVFSDAFQKVRLTLDPKKKTIGISSRNTDRGESSEEIKAAVAGEALELSFNHRYLQTPLSVTSAESISLSAAGPGRPLVIRGSGDTSFLYLVMPMNQ